MFVAVTFCRAQRLFSLPRGTQARRCSCTGSEYWHLRQRLSARGAPRWGEIARMAGGLGSKLVLPPGIFPPPGYGLRCCPLEPYFGMLALSAAQKLLDAMGEGAAHAEVGFIDPEGAFCREAVALARCCAVLRVYTRRRERYLELARRELISSGATLLLAEEPRALSACVFCVSPGPGTGLSLHCPVIAGMNGTVRGRPTADHLLPLLPPDAAAAVPQGIAPEVFFGALALCAIPPPDFPVEAGECRIDGRLADVSALLHPHGRLVQKSVTSFTHNTT